MAEKVSELSWVAFAKTELTKEQRKLVDDGALVKALAGLDKTDERKPAERLKALEAVVEQIPKLVVAYGKRKKELGKAFDEVKDKLYALLEAAEAQQKAMQKALDAEKDKGEEEEESPALLTTKMIPLLREVRKGELKLQALVAVAGKETVVLLSRRAISPARGRLLKEQMSNPSGLKFIRGECLYEENALTFVVQAPAAALAKRIRAALLAQTELRLKVRVRGEDGEDNALEDEDEAQEGPPVHPAQAGRAASVNSAGSASPTEAAGGPGMVAFTRTRLAWDGTRKKVQEELRKLEREILARCQAFPDAVSIAEGAKTLYNILDYLDERLIDKLDEALNATTPQERIRLHDEARNIVQEYRDYVNSEALFEDIDDNGFVPVAITSTLNASLGAIEKQLRAVVSS
jgi:hypothetical protein